MSNNRNYIKNLAKKFGALSNPHRLMIFTELANCCKDKECCSSLEFYSKCVGALAKKVNIAPSTLSHHLKELQHSQLIQMQRNGKNINCWVDKKTIEEFTVFFNNL